MDKVTVYNFQLWDQENGVNAWGLRMATREAIKRIGGIADLATAQAVERSEIDGNGFYPRKH